MEKNFLIKLENRAREIGARMDGFMQKIVQDSNLAEAAQQMGKAGGHSESPSKQAASKSNGKLGGRPSNS